MLRSPKLDASPRWRVVAGFAFLLIVALTAVLTLGAPLADAQGERMTVTSDTTYRVDVANDQVLVEGTYRLHNNLAPRDLGDGRREHLYFTNYHVVIPQSATNFSAQIDGLPVQTNYAGREHYDLAETWFPTELRYGDTITLTVSYTIPDSGPRADWGHAEISEEYVELTVWAQGSPGQSTVRVILPSTYNVDLVGNIDAFAQTTRSGETVLTASRIADAGDFNGQVLAYNENIRLENTSMTIHSGTAVVLARPSDPEWRDFVIDSLQNDLPVLERLIGIPWPHGNVVVEQSNEPRRDGFGGWYDSSDNTIKFESASREVLLHEFSHGWFNGRFSRDRWINEGLSEEFASRTIEARGGQRPDPEWPDPADSVRVPLSDWVRPDTVSNAAERRSESYHYDASWWVIRQITDDIGIDAFSDVLVKFNAVPGQSNRNWRTLYELLDESAVDDQKLDALFGTYVSASGGDVFQQRRAVLASYEQAFADSGFEAPWVITEQMQAWEWAAARPLVEEFATFVPRMAELRERAAASSIDISYYERVFESAQDRAEFERIGTLIASDIEAMNQLDADRIEVLAAAAVHGIIIDFDEAPLGIAERHANAARLAVDAIAADRTDLVEAAAAAGVAVSFDHDMAVEDAQRDLVGLQQRLDWYIERRRAIDERMVQLGLQVPVPAEPLPLGLAQQRLDEQASTVVALAAARSAIDELTVADRAKLTDKQGAASVLDGLETVEIVAAQNAPTRATDVATILQEPVAGGRNPVLPAVLSVMILMLGAIATVAFLKARGTWAPAAEPAISAGASDARR